MSQIEGKPLGNDICSPRLYIRVCVCLQPRKQKEEEERKRNITFFLKSAPFRQLYHGYQTTY